MLQHFFEIYKINALLDCSRLTKNRRIDNLFARSLTNIRSNVLPKFCFFVHSLAKLFHTKFDKFNVKSSTYLIMNYLIRIYFHRTYTYTLYAAQCVHMPVRGMAQTEIAPRGGRLPPPLRAFSPRARRWFRAWKSAAPAAGGGTARRFAQLQSQCAHSWLHSLLRSYKIYQL